MKDSGNSILWRVYLLYALILIWGLIIIGRIAYIQIYLKDDLVSQAEQQEIRMFNIESMRGNILAYDGSLLSTTVPVFEVRMDVASPYVSDQEFYTSLDSLSKGLASTLDRKTANSYKDLLTKARQQGNRYLLLSRNLSYSQVKALQKLPILRLGKYRGGLILIPGHKRERPYKELAQRTIGYENQQEKIFVGIEGAYHEYLKGTDGKQVKRRINNGDWKPLFDENTVEPRNGNDVVTSIDVNIQDVAQNALRKNLYENQAEQGCAILMEVETGYVVAIANLNLDKKTGTYKESYNFAIAESVEPGSTFKLASMLALLEDGKVKTTDELNIGNGQIRFHSKTMRDVYPIRDGHITVQEAFEKSSNVAIASMVYNAYKEQPEKYVEHMQALSLDKVLGIDIQGEGKPYIKHPRDKQHWYGTSLPWMAIGYEVKMTPLQMLTLYNAIANNGKMVKPLFVKEIRQGNIVIEHFEPVVLNKAIASPATIATLRNLLEGVVENGTARSLRNSPFKIAGKTGTAQIASGKKGYNKENYNASFVGYFPASNPKYSCIVFISNPAAGKIYGGAVAAPVFKEIADKVYASRPGIHDGVANPDQLANGFPRMESTCNSDDMHKLYGMFGIQLPNSSPNSQWIKPIVTSHKTLECVPVQMAQGLIPDVIGMNVRDAVYLLEDAGLHPTIQGKGKVAAQSLQAGEPIIKGSRIELKLMNL